MLNLKSVACWLEQFEESERETAEYAIQEIQFVTTDEIKHDLSVALQELVEEAFGPDDRHILLESVLSQEDVYRFLRAQAEERRARDDYFTLDVTDGAANRAHPNAVTVAATEAPREKPLNETVPYLDYFPSEVRDRESGSEKFLDLTIREELRRLKRRCRQKQRRSMILSSRNEIGKVSGGDAVELILLTDNIGSGSQVVDFIAAINRARIRGPFQDCIVRVRILAWTATVEGVTAVQRCLQQHFGESHLSSTRPADQFFDIIYMRETSTFKDERDPKKRDQALQFFQRYGDPKRRKPSRGLGFGQVASKFVMVGSSCPNNLPDMFYLSQRNSPYRPLFLDKSIPGDITQHVMQKATNDQKTRGTKLNYDEDEVKKARLVQAARRPDKDGDPTWSILIQAVLGKDKWAAVRTVKASYHQFTRSQDLLFTLGWVTRDFEATERGEKVLRQYGLQKSSYDYKSAHHLVQRQIDGESLPYYPQSMRGVR